MDNHVSITINTASLSIFKLYEEKKKFLDNLRKKFGFNVTQPYFRYVHGFGLQDNVSIKIVSLSILKLYEEKKIFFTK